MIETIKNSYQYNIKKIVNNLKIFFINYIKKIINFILYKLYYYIILFSIKKINFTKPKINLLYPGQGAYGFGDYLFFCSEARKLINENCKIFCFSKLQYEIANFFCNKQYIIKSFILMPKIMNESHFGLKFIDNNKNFNSTILMSPHNKKIKLSSFYNGTKETESFIINKIYKLNISKEIKKIFKKKTLCIFIKHYSRNTNKINFQVRQTRDIKKIFQIINFLNSFNINIIILGKSKDESIKKIKNNLNFKKINNVFFLKDLSKKYSIEDQAYVACRSIGYLGSDSGANGFFGLLNKKHIIIDGAYSPFHKYLFNFYYFYKKIHNTKNNKITKAIWGKIYSETNTKIIETSYRNIKYALLKKILIPHRIL